MEGVATRTIYLLLADLVLLLHFAFIVTVVAGGLAVLRRPRLALLHLPAAAWGVAVELAGWSCPLTALENRWRLRGGGAGSDVGCLERYLAPLVFPAGLDRDLQLTLGFCALAVNLAVYLVLLRRWRRKG